MNALIYALFALSGFAGLIYEGSWARYLKLFLGHSSYGQVLTLCIYMGGLAIGSFLAGKIVEKIRRPLLGYALTELGIGLGGVIYHPLYNLLTEFFFSSEWTASLSTRSAEIVKVTLATATTLPIAIAVGMTFPFIASGLLRKSKSEISLPRLYFTNSLGSAIGILFTSYLLIPSLGNHATLCVAATINFLLAAAFFFIESYSNNISVKESLVVSEEPPQEKALPMPPKRVWLWIAALTGLTSFVYEIVWIRLLSLLMGSSSHSFDQMLSAFILGLSLGSLVSGKLIKKDSLIVLSLAQILMAFFALCTLYFHVPFWMAMNESNQIFNATADGYLCWSLFKYALSLLWMVPTSFFAGMTLPLITLILTRAFKSDAPIGKVYGYNTLGSIIGSAGGGLLLLPLLQLKGALVLAAVLDFAVGFFLLIFYRKKFRYSPLFYAIACFAILPSAFVSFDPSLITSGAFRAYKNLHPDEKIIVRDGKTATISFHESKVHFYVKTNGKADASLSKDRSKPIAGDELTQAATAFMPMGVLNKPYDAAMIGFGSGMGAHYLLSDPLLKNLDCVEIEEEMMTLAKGFYPWNARGYDDPRIQIFIDDAGTFFHTHRKQYDLMVSVPSNPWVSGVASLFSYEFYRKMRSYMKPGGLWVQWIQTYEFNDLLFLHILKALDQEFPYVSLYRAPEEPDIIIIASDSPVRQTETARFQSDSTLVREFDRIHLTPHFFDERNFLFTSEMVRPILDGIEPNSFFKPIVDNGAEEARFVHSDAHIVEIFDSCEVCWQEYLSKDEYEKRLPQKLAAAQESKKDSFAITAILSYLENFNREDFSKDSSNTFTENSKDVPAEVSKDSTAGFSKDASTEASQNSPAELSKELSKDSTEENSKEAPNGWDKFREEYFRYTRLIPMEFRNSDSVYQKALTLSRQGKLPKEFAEEIEILESARQKNYAEAAQKILSFYERYEIREMDAVFLRNIFILSLLAEETELAFAIYKEAVQDNDEFYPVEKRLMERSLRKARRENGKRVTQKSNSTPR